MRYDLDSVGISGATSVLLRSTRHVCLQKSDDKKYVAGNVFIVSVPVPHVVVKMPPRFYFVLQELRRDAFALAGERYAELEPSLARLNALETEQKELEAKEAEKRREKKASGPRSSRR